MDSGNIYYLSMLTRLLNLCNTNEEKIATLAAFVEYLADLADRKAKCDGYVVLLQQKTLGITSNSLKLRGDVSLYFSVASSLVSSFGASINDSILKNMIIFNYSQLYKTKIEELKSSVVTILKVIDENKLALGPFGITPTFILKLKELQTELNTTAFGTKNAIDQHKATNELLDEELAEIQIILTEKMDTLANFFKLGEKGFYKLYKSARKVAHRHMHDKTPVPPDPTTCSLDVTIFNNATGIAMKDVNLVIMSIDFTINSDENGEIYKPGLPAGEYTGKLTCEGFVPIEFTFTAKLGETTDLGFIMNPIKL